jgi:hypothetical protein
MSNRRGLERLDPADDLAAFDRLPRLHLEPVFDQVAEHPLGEPRHSDSPQAWFDLAEPVV